MILTPSQSKSIVDRLRAELNPIKIYLFGSQATGLANEDASDIDLCIVVPDDGEHPIQKAARAYRSLRGLGMPKDILVRSQSQFEERVQWINSMEKEVMETGRLLFAK